MAEAGIFPMKQRKTSEGSCVGHPSELGGLRVTEKNIQTDGCGHAKWCHYVQENRGIWGPELGQACGYILTQRRKGQEKAASPIKHIKCYIVLHCKMFSAFDPDRVHKHWWSCIYLCKLEEENTHTHICINTHTHIHTYALEKRYQYMRDNIIFCQEWIVTKCHEFNDGEICNHQEILIGICFLFLSQCLSIQLHQFLKRVEKYLLKKLSLVFCSACDIVVTFS